MKWFYLYTAADRRRLGQEVLVGLAAATAWGSVAAIVSAILVAIYFD